MYGSIDMLVRNAQFHPSGKMIFFSWIYEGQNKIRVQISVQISFKIWNKWAYIYYKGDGYYSLEVFILK